MVASSERSVDQPSNSRACFASATRIGGSPRNIAGLDLETRNGAGRVDNFAGLRALSACEIYGDRAAAEEMPECKNMRAGEVGDVHIIANSGPVPLSIFGNACDAFVL